MEEELAVLYVNMLPGATNNIESQKNLGWKWPLKVISPSLLLKAELSSKTVQDPVHLK